jgi:HEAT repeat protein
LLWYSGVAVKHPNEVPGDDKTAGTRRKIIILILMIAVAGGCLFCVLPPAEPSYQGKSLSVWIRGLEYENVNPTDEQRAALRAMGDPAVKRLIRILQSRDSAIKRKFVTYAQHHADIHNRFIAPRYVIPEDVYHSEAATALGEIGPAAQAAIPALTTASTNKYFLVAARAKAALINIRQESITPLLVLLADTQSTNWCPAALTVKYLGTNGEAAVPLLISALPSTNVGIRQYAVWGLGGIASRPDLAVPALLGCLQDKSPYIRRNAVDALCKLKGAKQQIVPLLLSHLQDSDNNVWLGAAFGLEGLLDQDEKRTLYVPALVKCLDNPAEIIRVNAATFLKRSDPEAAAKAGVK